MRARNQTDWSFLLMRGADRSVKQFNVSKRYVVATPVVLIAAISSCFIGLQLKAASDIKELKEEISSYQTQYAATLAEHEEESAAYIENMNQLQARLENAYKQQQQIEAKLAELTKLEQQLEQFIETYGEATPLSLDRDVKTSDHYANILSHIGAYTEDNQTYMNGIPSANRSYASDLAASPMNQDNLTSNYNSSTITHYSNSSIGSSSPLTSFTYENPYVSAPLEQNTPSITDNRTSLSRTQDYHFEIASIAVNQNYSFQELSSLIDNFIEVMDYNFTKAKKIRQEVDAYPNYWPTNSKVTTSGYGYRKDPFTGTTRFHAGIDIDGRRGDAVFSAGDGHVTEAGFDHDYGYFVVVEHTPQLKTLYAHLSQIEAKAGDEVVKGEKIGLMGSSGRSTGTHLHFQVMLNDKPVSPIQYLVKS